MCSVLHHATILEIKLKDAEEWAHKMDILDSVTDMSGHPGSEWDEDFELTVSDASAITVVYLFVLYILNYSLIANRRERRINSVTSNNFVQS